MQTAASWWSGLTSLNQGFYMAASFFSLFLLWQLVMAVFGLAAGDAGLDSDVGHDFGHDFDHDAPHDATQTVAVFKLFSVRSMVAFFTLFSWAGALYLNNGKSVPVALGFGVVWGAAGFIIMSFLLNLMSRMTETGTSRIASCVGAESTVYLDIPAQGEGEVRVMMSGALTHLRARSADGSALPSGSRVRVKRVTGPTSVEVEKMTEPEPGGKQ